MKCKHPQPQIWLPTPGEKCHDQIDKGWQMCSESIICCELQWWIVEIQACTWKESGSCLELPKLWKVIFFEKPISPSIFKIEGSSSTLVGLDRLLHQFQSTNRLIWKIHNSILPKVWSVTTPSQTFDPRPLEKMSQSDRWIWQMCSESVIQFELR